jgi:hypothetical protein
MHACRQLEASGRTLGQLSPSELDCMCSSSAEQGRATSRLTQLLDLAYRMGLLSSGDLTGGWAGVCGRACLCARDLSSGRPLLLPLVDTACSACGCLTSILLLPLPPAVVPVGTSSRQIGSTAASSFAVRTELFLQEPGQALDAADEAGGWLHGWAGGQVAGRMLLSEHQQSMQLQAGGPASQHAPMPYLPGHPPPCTPPCCRPLHLRRRSS